MLQQCVPLCCSVLQSWRCARTCLIFALQCVAAVTGSVLHCVSFMVLYMHMFDLCVAVCCNSVGQCVAVMVLCMYVFDSCVSVCCSMLQCVVVMAL